MKPPLVVSGQDGVCASVLEASDQRLQAAEGASDQLGAAERLQAAAVLQVVLLDQVVDAHGRVAVSHIESTPCGWETARIGFYGEPGPLPGQQRSMTIMPNQQFSDDSHVT